MAKGKPYKKPSMIPTNEQNFKILSRKVTFDATYGNHISDKSYFKVEMYNDSMPVTNGKLYVLKDFTPNMKGFSSKKFAGGKSLGVPSKPPTDKPNYDIILRKLVLEVEPGDLVGEDTRFDVVMYNETHTVISGFLYLLKDTYPDIKIAVKGSRLASTNQWLPILDQGRHVFCDYYNNDVAFMKHVLEASNITGCPIKKGVYAITNMVVDEKGFPPGIPDSEFKIEAAFNVDKTKIGKVTVFADIKQKEDDDDDD